MRRPAIRTLLVPLLGVFLMGPVARAEDRVMQAMRDELLRSMEHLRLEELNKPYFVSYAVEELSVTEASAEFGSLLSSDVSLQRWLNVEVRVGSYDLDSSNFMSSDSPPFMFQSFRRARLPMEDNYLEIRRQLWLATDRAYKDAVENLAKKKAVLQSRTRSEELPDFSKEQPTTIEAAASPAAVGRKDVETLVRDLSSRFRKMPEIQHSEVQLYATISRTRYLNSEGSSFQRILPLVTLAAKATTQAADGMLLEDFVTVTRREMRDLPPTKELAASIDSMGVGLAALRQASLLELYNGPVLFEGPAAAELLAQVLLPALIAVRQPVREQTGMPMFMQGASGSLGDKIGSLVLPRFLSVTDDPTQSEFKGAILAGSYTVDDEGVPTRPTRLIEHGVLKTLLADRTPVTGVQNSTGNRRGGTIMPSNVIMTTEDAMNRAALVQKLLDLVQARGIEYGVLVRRMGNAYYKDPGDPFRSMFFPGSNDESAIEGPIEAYKLYPDGRQELIRNARISGIDPASFKDIVAASNEVSVYTAPFAAGQLGAPPPSYMLRAGMALPVVSWIVPSLLFEDLTLKKPTGEAMRPPIASHPYFDRERGQ